VLVEAIQETGQPHKLQILADKAVTFFGLDGSSTSVRDARHRTAGTRHAGRLVVFQDPSRSGLRIEFAGSPGTATFELRNLDGTILERLADQTSTDGLFRVAWNPARRVSRSSQGAYLLTVRMDGRVVASHRFAML